MIKRSIKKYKSQGIKGFTDGVINKLIKYKSQNIKIIQSKLHNKIALEIGGPSAIFSNNGLLPIYCKLQSIDNCNFSKENLWKNNKNNINIYKNEYIADVTDLSSIHAKYDVIITSHMLEHSANPIKAMHEMISKINQDGYLFLIVPHHQNSFDRKRPITTFKHILDDYQKNTTEDDLTHLTEILSLHDYNLDFEIKDHKSFETRCKNNIIHRGMHHHVFDENLIKEIATHMKLDIIFIENIRNKHIMCLLLNKNLM